MPRCGSVVVVFKPFNPHTQAFPARRGATARSPLTCRAVAAPEAPATKSQARIANDISELIGKLDWIGATGLHIMVIILVRYAQAAVSERHTLIYHVLVLVRLQEYRATRYQCPLVATLLAGSSCPSHPCRQHTIGVPEQGHKGQRGKGGRQVGDHGAVQLW